MFKAIDHKSGEEIIILDSKWAKRLGYLRVLDSQDILVCQQCQQPVRVRAGRLRRWHFAHKHLQDCPLQSESPEILTARAILYQWLTEKFGEAVTLEKRLPSEQLSRPIAYWLIETQVKPVEREKIKQEFERLGININWVFLTKMLHEDKGEAGQLFLTTTEREFRQVSDYNQIDQSIWRDPGQSLHYLDPEREMVITFRSLRLIHSPQIYGGRKESHPLTEILVSRKTGELVHPNEYERLQEWENAKAEAEQRQRDEEEQNKKELKLFQERLLSLSKNYDSNFREGLFNLEERNSLAPPIQDIFSSPNEAICELCGNKATDWYSFNNLTKTCKCMDCYRKLANH